MTMMVEVKRAVPDYLHQGFDKIQAMGEEECLRLWANITASEIGQTRTKCQMIYHFHQQGWDIERLGNGHAYYYLRIATGQLLPELFELIQDPALLEIYSELGIPDQERCVRNDEVVVVTGFNDSGEPYSPRMSLQAIAPRVARILCHGKKINDKGEQVRYLRARLSAKQEPRPCKLLADKRNHRALCKLGNVTAAFSFVEIEAMYNTLKKR